MNKFKYIFEDEKGFTSFDRYFDHLRTLKNTMPEVLYEFVVDISRYELHGAKTLHDARISSLNAVYPSCRSFSSQVELVLLSADFDKKLRLEYSGVVGFNGLFIANDESNRPVDLLTHEFTVTGDGLFKHVIEFDRDVWFEVVFTSFAYQDFCA
jgi:hypothetical protein